MGVYKGILWDTEEVPYFRKMEGTIPGMEDITISQAASKKLNLERDIRKLVEAFEKETDLRVISVGLLKDADEQFSAVSVVVAL